MYYGLYMSAAGAYSQTQKVEVLSNNVANANTVGFKRELALLESRESEAIERGLARRGSRTVDDVGGGAALRATATDFAPGDFQETGSPLDFAIEGDVPDVFFLVQRGGQQLLTRAGNFHLSSEGELKTAQGDAVLSADGDPIVLDQAQEWRALPGGVIEQGGSRVELGLARPLSLRSLQKIGHNYFSAKSMQLAEPPDRRVRSGFLELSGIKPVDEMVELIAASRAHEANVRLIQQHDQATSQLINRMLRI
jgi:flagellar basal-body rod protein FlgF/flagellar basal-body rod protein FlgG